MTILSDAALVWKFQRYDLLKTYHARSPIIPPFNLLLFPLILMQKIARLVSQRFCAETSTTELRMPIKIPYSGKESIKRKTTSYEKFQQKQKRNDIEMNPKIPLLSRFRGSIDDLDSGVKTVTRRQNKLTIFENIAFDMTKDKN